MKRALNSFFDRLVRPTFRFGGRSWSCFQVFGGTGLVLSIVLILTLAIATGLSVPAVGVMIVADIVALLALIMITKIILGEERLTYCHHEIVLLVVTAGMSWLLAQPVLSFLDISILSLGLGLMCGRIGCLMVGCCHGRPARLGVRYGAAHVAAGFSPHYGMTRFLPIQIIESIWVGAIVAVGTVLVLRTYPPGTALSFYVCAYGGGRFCFEFVRADTDRAYVWGFSESQWISLGLMLLVVCGEFFGVLPLHWWHVAATALVTLTMVVVAVRRRLRTETNYQLLLPRHVDEIAQALDSTSTHADSNGGGTRRHSPGIAIDCTSLGVQISAGRIKVAGSLLYHYALSNNRSNLTEASARTLAKLIVQLRHPAARSDLVAGRQGVFHLLVGGP
jgi:prolipoprotein diacylglyceryl transferase